MLYWLTLHAWRFGGAGLFLIVVDLTGSGPHLYPRDDGEAILRARDGLTNSQPATVQLTINPIFAPRFVSMRRVAGDLIEIGFKGEPGKTFEVDSSEDLVNWSQIVTLENTNTNTTVDPFFYFYLSTSLYKQEFFRARMIP
jgi:hypothetical protein